MRVLNYSGSGIETTFTQGEDACLAALVPELPREPADAPRSLLVVGALADVVEDQIRAAVRGARHRAGRASCRRAAPPSCRRSGPNTRFLLAQPFLAETARALEERGATRLRGALPARRRGHHRAGCEAAADAWRRRRRRASAAVTDAGARARAQRRSRAHRATLAGKRDLLLPRLASSRSRSPASWRASCGMQPVEVGTPYLHRQHLAAELALLPRGTALSAKARTSTGSSTAAAPRGPTSSVCGLGLANPLEAEGLATKWSIELVFTPIQGYEQAGDLAELFARPLVRRTRLEA